MQSSVLGEAEARAADRGRASCSHAAMSSRSVAALANLSDEIQPRKIGSIKTLTLFQT